MEQLGTHETQIGSQNVQFASILQLDAYTRRKIVMNFIDGLHNDTRLSSKRKAVENGQDDSIQPPPKIIKPNEITTIDEPKFSDDYGEFEAEGCPKLIGPEVKEEYDQFESMPALEPKTEPISKNMNDTKTRDIIMHEELSGDPESDIKSEGISSFVKNESDEETDESDEETDDDSVIEDIPKSFKIDLKTETKNIHENGDESEEEFFVADEETLQNIIVQSSRPLDPQKAKRLQREKMKKSLERWMYKRHQHLVDQWHQEDSKIIQSNKIISNAAWAQKVKKRCSLLNKRLLVRNPPNIIPFEINFWKECVKRNIYQVN